MLIRIAAVLAILAATLATLNTASAADAAALARALNGMLADLDKARDALKGGGVAEARAAYHEFDEGWEKNEDDVRGRSRDAYTKIEDAMGEVQIALVKAEAPDAARADAALAGLSRQVRDFAATLPVAPAATEQADRLPRAGTPGVSLVALGFGLATFGCALRLRSRRVLLGLTLALLAGLAVPLQAWADDPVALAEGMRGLSARLAVVQQKVDAGDAAAALAVYKEFDQGWGKIEDEVRPRSRPAYRAIEDGMLDVKAALVASPLDRHKATGAIAELDRRVQAFVTTLGIPAPAPTVAPSQPVGPIAVATAPAAAAEPTRAPVTAPVPVTAQPAAVPPQPAVAPAAAPAERGAVAEESPIAEDIGGLVAHLDRAAAALERGDAPAAAAAVEAFRRDWPDVEGEVKARSAGAYGRSEDRIAQAAGLLGSTPPAVDEARRVIGAMREDLAPMTETPTRYGPFDAAVILLREGLEALLIVSALLAFLNKTGNADKGRWIWAGSATGVLASVLVAVLVNILFSRAAAGANRELIEGVVGLAAAAMLVYVSYWLHSKASLGAWQRYIRDRSSAALARKSLLSLAALAFLAVFREGAETALFYVGIAPSITLADLALGLGVGAAALAVVGLLVLGFGVRLPIRPFFLASSVLIYYLAFKFVGTGIHALQVAGILGSTSGRYLPKLEVVGLFPTWETTLPQLALLVVAVLAVLYVRSRQSSGAAAAAR
ncbi:MAG TPA: FTR1 family protein [Chloroflexota bacterium]|nr:FTR1 family protein [Chloroflexota bacterium]